MPTVGVVAGSEEGSGAAQVISGDSAFYCLFILL